MQQAESAGFRRAANWMAGLGILYGLVAVMLGCAAAFMSGEAGRGGDWSGVAFVLGLLGGGLALYCFGVGAAVLALQAFVRRGRREAIVAAGWVCWLAALLPMVPLGAAAIGHLPDARATVGLGLMVMIWAALHLRIAVLLRKAHGGS